MKIFYCRIGWMSAYKGSSDERPVNGGSYNKNNIGHEVHNYLGYNGKYYGYVEPGLNGGTNNSIHIERLGSDKKDDFIDGILVVWISVNPDTGGQFIVGWYKNARVYRKLQNVPENVMKIRNLETHHFYNVYSEQVTLLNVSERKYQIIGMGHSNLWYGNSEIDKAVIDYIDAYDTKTSDRIEAIEKGLDDLEGYAKESVVKTRVNQDKFRNALCNRYKHCCLCSISNPVLLVASHIKPWSKSDSHEKLDINNGLLLCPNHDKLFDSGLITFDDDGEIIISDMLDATNRIFTNINENMRITVNEDNQEYMRYHRNNVFKK